MTSHALQAFSLTALSSLVHLTTFSSLSVTNLDLTFFFCPDKVNILNHPHSHLSNLQKNDIGAHSLKGQDGSRRMCNWPKMSLPEGGGMGDIGECWEGKEQREREWWWPLTHTGPAEGRTRSLLVVCSLLTEPWHHHNGSYGKWGVGEEIHTAKDRMQTFSTVFWDL